MPADRTFPLFVRCGETVVAVDAPMGGTVRDVLRLLPKEEVGDRSWLSLGPSILHSDALLSESGVSAEAVLSLRRLRLLRSIPPAALGSAPTDRVVFDVGARVDVAVAGFVVNVKRAAQPGGISWTIAVTSPCAPRCQDQDDFVEVYAGTAPRTSRVTCAFAEPVRIPKDAVRRFEFVFAEGQMASCMYGKGAANDDLFIGHGTRHRRTSTYMQSVRLNGEVLYVVE
eukprot:TRINITY_DN13580_c0_g4_i1.p1 TRINITY_DN13580_c0_g4~~TRINITY_DN13580_c0_g4_i1.p1  ORF type:complete len:256 (+),score=52.67 TRINITY_DN13580_c0_g4_i1:89-769(+)